MTKVISISDEAYDRLKKIKDGMSFTEIIIELSECKKPNIMEFAGILTEKEGEEMLSDILKERKVKSRRFQ